MSGLRAQSSRVARRSSLQRRALSPITGKSRKRVRSGERRSGGSNVSGASMPSSRRCRSKAADLFLLRRSLSFLSILVSPPAARRGFSRSGVDHWFITFDKQQKARETFESSSSALRPARAEGPKVEFLGGPAPVGWGGPSRAIPDFHRTMHGNVIGPCNHFAWSGIE